MTPVPFLQASNVVYVHAGQQVIADYARGAAAAAPSFRYVYGSYVDEPLVRHAGTGTTLPTSGTAALYYHRNQQYSIVGLSDAAGTLVERYAYTAYGELTILAPNRTARATSSFQNRYTYTGREWDPTLRLYYFRARWLEPKAGRFIGRDPLGYVDGINLYSNTFATSYVDPLGTHRRTTSNCSGIDKPIPGFSYESDWDFKFAAISFSANARLSGEHCAVNCCNGDEISDWSLMAEGSISVEINGSPWRQSFSDSLSGLEGMYWLGINLFGKYSGTITGGSQSNKCVGDTGSLFVCGKLSGGSGFSIGGHAHLYYSGGIWGMRRRLLNVGAYGTGEFEVSLEKCCELRIVEGLGIHTSNCTGKLCLSATASVTIEFPSLWKDWNFDVLSGRWCMDL
ncbi:MAG: RHS repeat domain-containing protein [Planctomycetota bacterium]